MLDSVDEWLTSNQETLLKIEHITENVYNPAYGHARLLNHPSDATVQLLTQIMTLSRSFALPRFSSAVEYRLKGLQPDEKMSVLAAEVQQVRAELAMLRPAPRAPLLIE